MHDTHFLMVKMLGRDKDKPDDSNAYKIKNLDHSLWRYGRCKLRCTFDQICVSAIFAANGNNDIGDNHAA